MKKRLISCGAVLVIGAGAILTGCQNSKTEYSRPSEEKKTASRQVWQIGVIASKTGEQAEEGMSSIEGIELAINEINASGGINGYEIMYLAMDDENNTKKAINSFKTLNDWGMDFLIGATGAETTEAVAKLADENQILMITPAVMEDKVVSEHESLYELFLSEKDLGEDVAEYAKSLGNITAIFTERNDATKSKIARSYKAKATDLNVEVVLDKRLSENSDYEDFLEELSKCKEKNVDVLFMPVSAEHGSMIFKAAEELDYDPQFVGMGEIGKLLENDEKRSIKAGRIYAVTETNYGNLTMLAFAKKYKQAYDKMPENSAAWGYDSVFILKEALENAGINPEGVSEEQYTAVKAAMSTFTYSGLIGIETSWKEDGLVEKQLFSRPYFNIGE